MSLWVTLLYRLVEVKDRRHPQGPLEQVVGGGAHAAGTRTGRAGQLVAWF
jgi:hypothetical protein